MKSYLVESSFIIMILNIQLRIRDLRILRISLHKKDSARRNRQVSQQNYFDNIFYFDTYSDESVFPFSHF